MPFGTNASACHFQSLMFYLMNKEPEPPRHATYLDDCTIGGNEI